MQHRPDLPAVIARWQRAVTAAELQAGYGPCSPPPMPPPAAAGCWTCAAAKTSPSPPSTPGSAAYSRPRYAAATPRPMRLALSHFATTRPARLVTAIVSATNADCEIATFTDRKATAHAWLSRS
ncbi:MAG: hypothetical protein WKG07_11185 [Hymenobacter sp.]